MSANTLASVVLGQESGRDYREWRLTVYDDQQHGWTKHLSQNRFSATEEIAP